MTVVGGRTFWLGLLVLVVAWGLSLGMLARAEDPEHPAAGEAEAHGAAVAQGHAEAEHDAEAAGAHGDPQAAEASGAHAGEHAEEHGAHFHIPSLLDLIVKLTPEGSEGTFGKYVKLFQPTIFGLILAIIIAIITQAATRSMTYIPGKLQNVVELVIGGLADFVGGVVGERGRHLVPFLGTLFLYIWLMNLMGLIPFMMSPTSHYRMTVALAIAVFLYVQWTGIRQNGLGRFLYHLAGEPKDAIGWSLVVLMLPLHVIGELARPLSLSLRLFGNIFGEDTLIAVFATLGVIAISFLHLPIGLPFQIPFVFLALLTGTIQALVFALLSTIYFALALPHEHEEH